VEDLEFEVLMVEEGNKFTGLKLQEFMMKKRILCG
jgi:hypothetical protein